MSPTGWLQISNVASAMLSMTHRRIQAGVADKAATQWQKQQQVVRQQSVITRESTGTKAHTQVVTTAEWLVTRAGRLPVEANRGSPCTQDRDCQASKDTRIHTNSLSVLLLLPPAL
jgi:hypothetical protein